MASTEIRIGTSGYSYPGPPPKGWYEVFYPSAGRKRLDELEYYSLFFDTVEINSTFYRPPAPTMARAWARKTPPRFEFAVKAWQKFTHPRKIGEGVGGGDAKTWEQATQADVKTFKDGIDPLFGEGKLGALLFQFPPGFRLTPKNSERLQWILEAFADYPKVVELRHRSWSDKRQETLNFLKEMKTSWVVIDEPKFTSSVRQEFEPVENFLYLRLHGRNWEKWWKHDEAWERYDYFYGPEEIQSLATKMRKNGELFPGSKVYVFFNNHARGQAVVNGLMLKNELNQSIAAPVPESMVKAFPQIARFAKVVGQGRLL